eukprot:UN01454
MNLNLISSLFVIQSVIAFDCVLDVPSTEFLTQENSYVSFYQIDDISMEVQVFNSDKMNSDYSPLLFIHGYTDSRWSFLSTIQCMNIGDRAIIVPSLRGFGDSQIYPIESSTFSIAEFASDLSKLLDLLQVDKAVWIGHSMGSWITHYAAGNIATKVDSIILLATGASMDAALCEDIDAYLNTSCPDREFIDVFQEKDFIAEHISVAYANQVVRESYKVDIAPYQKAWYELCDFDNADSYIGSITVNTTIIWGSEDLVTRVDYSFVDMFTATTPNVEIVSLPNVGHNVQWYAPEEVADIIKDHINYVQEENGAGGKYEMIIILSLCQIVYFIV